MRNCFIPGCDQQHKNSSKRAMFLAPRDVNLLDKWIEALPKVRTFRPHDKVCHLHFRNEDVIYNYEHRINGKIYQLERGRPRLKPNAIPSINLPTNEEIKILLLKPNKRAQKNILKKHNSNDTSEVDVRKETPPDEQIQQAEIEDVDEIGQNEHGTKLVELIYEPEDNAHTFDYIYDNYHEVELPDTLWAVHRCPNRRAIFFSYINVETMFCSKIISITSNGLVKAMVEDRVLYESSLDEEIHTMELLASLVAQVNNTEVCAVD